MSKYIILFLIFLSSTLLAQVSGKSNIGRLFSKKKVATSENISSPIITIFSPAINNGVAQVDKGKILIHGKVEDKYGLKSILLNQNSINISNSNEFYYEMNLSEGLNPINIEAKNNKEKITSQNFNIEFKADKKLPIEIILTQPILTSQNDFITNNGIITLRGKINNLEKSGKVNINNVPISLSKNGEFFYQFNLLRAVNPVLISAENDFNDKSEFKFNIINSSIKSVPIIQIIEPVLPRSNELIHNESIITVRGKVDDSFAIRDVKVNNQPAAILGKNEFFANVNLNDGVNNIVVLATNIKGTSSEKLFKVITPVDDKGPEITILEPQVSRGLKIVRKKDVLDVRGIVSDRSGVLNVKVNNREVSLLPNKEFITKLYLGVGNNTIIVKATDNKYNISIDTFYVTRELEQVIKTGKYIALLIGINSYEGYWHGLKNAVNDASELAQVLKDNYYFNEVHTLLDKEATRKNIIKKFEWLINTSTKDDNVLIFYAGHGQFKRELNKGYWVPVDAKTNSTADYISNNDIKTYIGGIPSKHTLLITDACFAGDIFRGIRTESIPFDPSDMTKYYREVYNKPSRLALTSGSLEQVSDAGKNNHSIFTYYLIKSLKENKRKFWDSSQLFNDFRMAVTNNSDQTPQLQVVRDTNDEGGQFVFIRNEQ